MAAIDINLKGGVIVIGSLLWDESPNRQNWRGSRLFLENRQMASLRIRYGRRSRTRQNTYTMIFSNHPSTGLGSGYLIEFINPIRSFDDLIMEALELAQAEGIAANGMSLANTWGAVGLWLNDKVCIGSNMLYTDIKEKWAKMYTDNRYFDSKRYQVENETAVIDQNGFLCIDFVNEMADYDFLLATPCVPNCPMPEAREVADRMIIAGYREYFDSNLQQDIRTFQDEDILKYLKLQNEQN